MAAQSGSIVFMEDGTLHQGELLAVSAEYVLLKEEANTLFIPRSEIKAMSYRATPEAVNKEKSIKRVSLHPLLQERKWLYEVETGLTFLNPFALRAGFGIWHQPRQHWQVGLSTTHQFYRFTMLALHANVRWLPGNGKYFRPFFGASFGTSYLAYTNGVHFRDQQVGSVRPANYSEDFSLVKQLGAGPGIYLDTGLGTAFTARVDYNLTWFELEERVDDDYRIKSSYLVSSASIICSFIF